MKWAILAAMAVFVSGCMGSDFPSSGSQSFVESANPATVETTRSSWGASFASGPKELQAAVDSGPLPFGAMRKVCGLAKRDLGTKVETEGGFTLYDTKPSLLAPRTHYVAGFRDRCVRKFTAGMAFLGGPMTHEVQRYANTSDFSAVDKAYETLKNRLCRVKSGERCGDRSDRIVKSTVFVSMYRQFTDSHQSGAVLLHNGRLQASDFDS